VKSIGRVPPERDTERKPPAIQKLEDLAQLEEGVEAKREQALEMWATPRQIVLSKKEDLEAKREQALEAWANSPVPLDFIDRSVQGSSRAMSVRSEKHRPVRAFHEEREGPPGTDIDIATMAEELKTASLELKQKVKDDSRDDGRHMDRGDVDRQVYSASVSIGMESGDVHRRVYSASVPRNPQ
jgi:hypothetical protein